MTKTEMLNRLIELQNPDDYQDVERNHMEADDIICELLILMKQHDIVSEYEKINKLYS